MRVRIAALLMLMCAAVPARAASRFVPGEVLVALPRGAASLNSAPAAGATPEGWPAFEALGLRVDRRLTTRRPLGRSAAAGEYLRLRSDREDFDPVAAAAALRASGTVRAACPNFYLRPLLTVPNDPYLSTQWHLSTSAAAIRARNAWDLQRGDSGVVIAIIDTGVDTGHPDLAAKIWRNAGEIAGNGLDDDDNGYVDDRFGWDFGEDDDNPDPVPFFDDVFGIDVGWHGTFAAALAGAATNNSVGVAGIAWGSKIMALKASNAASQLPTDAVAAAFGYAIAEGASVINLSLGTPDTLARAFFQALVNDAFDAGIVVVSAAGNDGTDEENFPAACESTLAVAATNPSNHRADFSNWGPYVDIAAPGEGMWSAIARNYEYDEGSQLFFEVLWNWDTVNPYMYGDGTSFSSPVVAGACALVRSRFPWMTPRQVMQQVVLRGDVVNYDNPIGPRLNLLNAVNAAAVGAPRAAAVAGAAMAAPFPNPTGRGCSLALTLPEDGPVRIEALDLAGRRVATLFDGPLSAGAHEVRWDGADADGRAVTPGLYFLRLVRDDETLVRRVTVLP